MVEPELLYSSTYSAFTSEKVISKITAKNTIIAFFSLGTFDYSSKYHKVNTPLTYHNSIETSYFASPG
jgi:hypothetical protein